ncbi:MAG: hypothetical protein ACKO6N_27585 [Myxococcota bacterium]
MSDALETFIREAFEANFERLREESGRAITPDVKAAALEQVLLYWRKLRALAEQVTETEVHLVLPEQRSPAGRRYTLEGVVDILRQEPAAILYDVKTYLDADAAREHVDPHYRQLNVYAHIWQTLRSQALDHLAIIATRPTRSLKHAMSTGDTRRIDAAFTAWSPVLDIRVQQQVVEEVIADFGRVVDEIEERHFAPPDVEVLRAPSRPGGRIVFGTDVCLNCDARFSCSSYRQFVLRSQQAQRPEAVLNYYLSDFGNDQLKDEWLDANLTTLDRAPDLGEEP